ncbi:lipoprotein signal peptidase [Clostridium sp. CAG:452]|jgi:signal peptidase II|nr:lipoprotein signal peptidase [Clostridium sp. CAG:452]
MKSKKINFLMIITIIAILLDQLIKIIIKSKIFNSSIILIPHVLNLTYVQNTGAAFGIGNNSTSMFVAVNVVIIGLITYFIFSKKEELSKLILIALHLVLAGGIGNLIDRIARGFVIDYIDISPLIKYPVFNLADIFVVIGCLIIAVFLVKDTVIKKKNIGE